VDSLYFAANEVYILFVDYRNGSGSVVTTVAATPIPIAIALMPILAQLLSFNLPNVHSDPHH